jgi:hypothetical protein
MAEVNWETALGYFAGAGTTIQSRNDIGSDSGDTWFASHLVQPFAGVDEDFSSQLDVWWSFLWHDAYGFQYQYVAGVKMADVFLTQDHNTALYRFLHQGPDDVLSPLLGDIKGNGTTSVDSFDQAREMITGVEALLQDWQGALNGWAKNVGEGTDFSGSAADAFQRALTDIGLAANKLQALLESHNIAAEIGDARDVLWETLYNLREINTNYQNERDSLPVNTTYDVFMQLMNDAVPDYSSVTATPNFGPVGSAAGYIGGSSGAPTVRANGTVLTDQAFWDRLQSQAKALWTTTAQTSLDTPTGAEIDKLNASYGSLSTILSTNLPDGNLIPSGEGSAVANLGAPAPDTGSDTTADTAANAANAANAATDAAGTAGGDSGGSVNSALSGDDTSADATGSAGGDGAATGGTDAGADAGAALNNLATGTGAGAGTDGTTGTTGSTGTGIGTGIGTGTGGTAGSSGGGATVSSSTGGSAVDPSTDEEVLGPDGKPVIGADGKPLTVPAGSVVNSNGTVTGPNGQLVTQNGKALTVPKDSTLSPARAVTDAKGNPIVEDGKEVTAPAGSTVNADGTITNPDGVKLLNSSGQAVVVPKGSRLGAADTYGTGTTATSSGGDSTGNTEISPLVRRLATSSGGAGEESVSSSGSEEYTGEGSGQLNAEGETLATSSGMSPRAQEAGGSVPGEESSSDSSGLAAETAAEEASVMGRTATTSGSTPMMPPMGGGGPAGGGQGGDRSRQTWLDEDEDVWGTAAVGTPGVIGG